MQWMRKAEDGGYRKFGRWFGKGSSLDLDEGALNKWQNANLIIYFSHVCLLSIPSQQQRLSQGSLQTRTLCSQVYINIRHT